MSSSWTRACPCKDCSFKNKNSYPLVNYIRNCDYKSTSTFTPIEDESIETITFICSWAKKCLKRGCEFKNTDVCEIIRHTGECPLPWDHNLFRQLLKRYDQYKASESNSKGLSSARGKTFSSKLVTLIY